MSGSDANHSHLEDGQEENSAKLNDANVEVVSNLEEKAPPSDALHPPPSDAPVHENDDGDVKEAEEEDEIALPKRRRQDSDGDEDEEHFHDAEDEDEDVDQKAFNEVDEADTANEKKIGTKEEAVSTQNADSLSRPIADWAADVEDEEKREADEAVKDSTATATTSKSSNHRITDPTAVPKVPAGKFVYHDDRYTEEEAIKEQQKKKEAVKKARSDQGKWGHDRFNLDDDNEDGDGQGEGGKGGRRGKGNRSKASSKTPPAPSLSPPLDIATKTAASNAEGPQGNQAPPKPVRDHPGSDPRPERAPRNSNNQARREKESAQARQPIPVPPPHPLPIPIAVTPQSEDTKDRNSSLRERVPRDKRDEKAKTGGVKPPGPSNAPQHMAPKQLTRPQQQQQQQQQASYNDHVSQAERGGRGQGRTGGAGGGGGGGGRGGGLREAFLQPQPYDPNLKPKPNHSNPPPSQNPPSQKHHHNLDSSRAPSSSSAAAAVSVAPPRSSEGRSAPSPAPTSISHVRSHPNNPSTLHPPHHHHTGMAYPTEIANQGQEGMVNPPYHGGGGHPGPLGGGRGSGGRGGGRGGRGATIQHGGGGGGRGEGGGSHIPPPNRSLMEPPPARPLSQGQVQVQVTQAAAPEPGEYDSQGKPRFRTLSSTPPINHHHNHHSGGGGARDKANHHNHPRDGTPNRAAAANSSIGSGSNNNHQFHHHHNFNQQQLSRGNNHPAAPHESHHSYEDMMGGGGDGGGGGGGRGGHGHHPPSLSVQAREYQPQANPPQTGAGGVFYPGSYSSAGLPGAGGAGPAQGQGQGQGQGSYLHQTSPSPSPLGEGGLDATTVAALGSSLAFNNNNGPRPQSGLNPHAPPVMAVGLGVGGLGGFHSTPTPNPRGQPPSFSPNDPYQGGGGGGGGTVSTLVGVNVIPNSNMTSGYVGGGRQRGQGGQGANFNQNAMATEWDASAASSSLHASHAGQRGNNLGGGGGGGGGVRPASSLLVVPQPSLGTGIGLGGGGGGVILPHNTSQTLQGEALVVAMAQQAAQQYSIHDPSMIAWLQGGLRQAMEQGLTSSQAYSNMQAYLQHNMNLGGGR